MYSEENAENIINLEKLLRIDMRHQTWLPCLMIIAVVINTGITITVLEKPILSYMALALELLSFAFMSYLYFRRGAMSMIVLMAIVFEMLLMISTIINGTDVKRCFYDGCSVIFVAMACDYYKDRFHMLVIAFSIAFSACVYLNILHLITHPDLWFIDSLKTNQGYLLGGNYNQMGSRLLCAVGTSIACLKYSRGWLVNVIPVTSIMVQRE